jgi:fructuronate reductase
VSASLTVPRLNRSALDAARAVAPPVRIVHVGLGAFHRAHQAWYTAHASDAGEWGIAAFTGRSPLAAEQLAAQDGVFTLVERGPEADRWELVSTIVRALPGSDLPAFIALLADPAVAVLTLTITEAGYRLDPNGLLDPADPGTLADIALLREGIADGIDLARLEPATSLGRVVLGLEARRRAGAGGLAVVPCDNLPDNGAVLSRALETIARAISPELEHWLPTGISVVSTSVDRITPQPTAEDRAHAAAATGWTDEAAVVTEPFSDWVLSGDFPSGRPDWASAGARFVDDIAPWQLRKLWMLNGAHTLLASLGSLRGHALVSEAIADPECRDAVERLWDEDARHLPGVDTDAYRAALVERFSNARIEHHLVQIGGDAATKVKLRIVPVALRERAAGRAAEGCATAVAAWILAVRSGLYPAPIGSDRVGIRSLITHLDSVLGADDDFRDLTDSLLTRLGAAITTTQSAPSATGKDTR